MTAAVVDLFRRREGTRTADPETKLAIITIRDTKIGCICDSIPASMSTASAREPVGQPFLADHALTRDWSPEVHGPVHIIACQKTVSESQAIRQLGFPDAVVVSAPFGVYVADEVQKMQMVFLANCRDLTTTQQNVQTFLNWLNEQGEAEYMVRRAVHRRQISDYVRNVGGMNVPATTKAARRQRA